MIVYHLKSCDTCRKAIKALGAAGLSLELIDVRADGVPEAALSRFIAELGVDKILNTRSTTWRGLDDAQKADVNEAKALTLLLAHPTLMKRPVIEAEGQLTAGWTKDVQALWL